MSPRLTELALKKRLLRQRSAVLRHTLATQVGAHVAPVLGAADRVVTSARWLRRHPAWLVGGAVALLVLRPKGLTPWLGRGLWLWRTWQRVQPMVSTLLNRPAATPSAQAVHTDRS